MNRLVLSATLVERLATRYTPAGLPALDLSLKHESEVSEDGQPRKVSMEIKAVAIGAVTRLLMPMALGSASQYAGFITSTRNGRGLLFHITSVDALVAHATAA
ncbi:MAG: primosomal replication protein N [Rubrivivax sp.]|nr:primosomal replication protein N [Rubrivivax sp.]